MRYFYLCPTIVSLYFYLASSNANSAPCNLDKLISTFLYINFCICFLFLESYSSNMFHEYINISYILSDIYVCFFFFSIDKYSERNTRNAMNLREKKCQWNWLSVLIQRWFDLLKIWFIGSVEERNIRLFLSLPHERRLPSLMRFNRSPKHVD